MLSYSDYVKPGTNPTKPKSPPPLFAGSYTYPSDKVLVCSVCGKPVK